MSDNGLSFFWHDYETFGRNPRRDRPVQFAGQRTDADLNPVGDPVMWYCKPATDSLPDPESCLLTGILPQRAQAHGVSEATFAARILGELGRPGTVGVGYNSIRFDDEVTRFLAWRTLNDPYAREWRDGCGRWDLLDVARAFWALRPQGLEWPTREDGRPSFRLEDLTRANGLMHEAAHDALSDVLATIALARRLKQAQPRLWEFCLKLRRKEAVLEEIGVERPFVHVSGRYPVERGGLAVVWPLGRHPVNRNEVIVWDLAHDPAVLDGLDDATVRRRLFTRREDLGEDEPRLPIKTIHINRSPIVVGNLRTLEPVAARWGIDLPQALAHASRAQVLAPAWMERWATVFARDADGVPVDVDEDLYGGFLSADDRRALDRLREADPATLATRRLGFDDPRLEELVFRWRARNHSQTLDAQAQARWEAHRAARLHDGEGGALPLAAFFEKLDVLQETADERGQALLEQLYDWAETIAPDMP
jgi:exodeoxyribonuclease-1